MRKRESRSRLFNRHFIDFPLPASRSLSPTEYALRDELTKQPDVLKAHVLVTTPIIRYVAKAVTEFAFTQSRNVLDYKGEAKHAPHAKTREDRRRSASLRP